MTLRAVLLPSPRNQPALYAFTCVALLYGALLAWPSFLFAEQVHQDGIHLYAHQSNPVLANELQKARTLLARSPIDAPDLPQRMYVTDSAAEFTFFSPANRKAFGATYPYADDTFLVRTDQAGTNLVANRANLNRRPTSSGIAHERTHALLAHHFGQLRMLLGPEWKQEGYCEYVAGGLSVGTVANGMALLASDRANEPAVRYFRDSLRVRYLLDREHLTVDEVFARDFNLAELDQKARATAAAVP